MNKNILSFKPIVPNEEQLTETLEAKVVESLYNHTEFAPGRIFSQTNKVKYYDPAQPLQEHDYLNEIFNAMACLNKQGLQQNSLGKLSEDGLSFQEAILEACKSLAEQFYDLPITYVELGPEPIKTAYILKSLLLLGVKIRRYIAVDINPVSKTSMLPALNEILSGVPIDFVTTSFEDFKLETFLDAQNDDHHYSPALITMLGFQEGNDEPSIMIDWMQNIARSGDLLLSEVQLYNLETGTNIPEFYRNPLMQRFSRIAFERAFSGTFPSLNRFFLLPVRTDNNGYINTAILGEEFIEKKGERSLFISNYCLKYTKQQFHDHRVAKAYFEIINEVYTEDQSLVFQISKRR